MAPNQRRGGARVATHGVVEQVCQVVEKRERVDASPGSGDQIQKSRGPDKTVNKDKLAVSV